MWRSVYQQVPTPATPTLQIPMGWICTTKKIMGIKKFIEKKIIGIQKFFGQVGVLPENESEFPEKSGRTILI